MRILRNIFAAHAVTPINIPTLEKSITLLILDLAWIFGLLCEKEILEKLLTLTMTILSCGNKENDPLGKVR